MEEEGKVRQVRVRRWGDDLDQKGLGIWDGRETLGPAKTNKEEGNKSQ